MVTVGGASGLGGAVVSTGASQEGPADRPGPFSVEFTCSASLGLSRCSNFLPQSTDMLVWFTGKSKLCVSSAIDW